jgi:hypothetical protein
MQSKNRFLVRNGRLQGLQHLAIAAQRDNNLCILWRALTVFFNELSQSFSGIVMAGGGKMDLHLAGSYKG